MSGLSVPCLRYASVDSDGNPVTENFDLVLPKELGVIELEPGCAVQLNMLTWEAYLACETDLLTVEECDVEESTGTGPFKVSSTFTVDPIPSTNNQLVTVTCVYSDGSQTVTTEVIEDLDNTITDADVVFINGEPFMQYTLEDGSTFNVPLPVECCTYFEDQTGSDFTVGDGPATTPATKNENDTIIEKYDNGLAFFKCDGSAWVEVMFCEIEKASNFTHEQSTDNLTVTDADNGSAYDFTTNPGTAPTNAEIGDDHCVYAGNGKVTVQFNGTDWIIQDVDLSCCPDATVSITFDGSGNPITTALNGKNPGTLAKGTYTKPGGCQVDYLAIVGGTGDICITKEERLEHDHKRYRQVYVLGPVAQNLQNIAPSGNFGNNDYWTFTDRMDLVPPYPAPDCKCWEASVHFGSAQNVRDSEEFEGRLISFLTSDGNPGAFTAAHWSSQWVHKSEDGDLAPISEARDAYQQVSAHLKNPTYLDLNHQVKINVGKHIPTDYEYYIRTYVIWNLRDA